MELKSTATVKPAADLREILRTLKPTPDEAKAITDARKAIRDAQGIAGQYQSKTTASRNGKQSPLELAVWQASDAFVAEPSAKTAQGVADAVARMKFGEDIEAALNSGVAQVAARMNEQVRPFVLSLVDRGRKQMVEQLDGIQALLDKSPELHEEAAAFAGKREAAVILADNLRKAAESEPLNFLQYELEL